MRISSVLGAQQSLDDRCFGVAVKLGLLADEVPPRQSFKFDMRRILFLTLFPIAAHAQQAVYKCEQNGSVTYTHEPCLRGEVIDATPTQGMDKMTGKSKKGASVLREERRKAMDDAFRPLTGASHEEMNVLRRRQYLSPQVKNRCAMLDLKIGGLERRAKTAQGTAKDEADFALYQARREFYWLKC